ncbi:hypothetical protein GCM10025857_31690 [Alicyclobacillus contaminans]|uniref:hypothetical protein n=1 Tax=Alicyclobacillus contaminans TaxID=392016 RepID=UPI000478CFE9|nr:hypothetical protein [Alicyclobacillus contaminans]GMA51812.1 hypothetical protein GCM10025857_31690 [Alicyclobacillus contaminans]
MPQRIKSYEEFDLQNFEKYYERELMGDMWALAYRMDYERVLASNALTPRDRQIICMYLLNLDEHEFAELLGITQQAISDRVTRCLRNLVRALTMAHVPLSQNVHDRNLKCVHPVWDKWMIDVLYNQNQWWRVPDDVRKYIQQRFGITGNAQDRTTYNEERDGEEYPIRFPKSWLGKDRTFKGQPRERVYMDELIYGTEMDSVDEPEFDMRIGKRNKRKRWADLPHDPYLKKISGFWSYPALNGEVKTCKNVSQSTYI